MRYLINSCVGKNPFTSYRQAEQAAAKMRATRSAPFQVYHCEACGHFHIGNRSSKRTPKKRHQQQQLEEVME
jgi:hypothetical protein